MQLTELTKIKMTILRYVQYQCFLVFLLRYWLLTIHFYAVIILLNFIILNSGAWEHDLQKNSA